LRLHSGQKNQMVFAIYVDAIKLLAGTFSFLGGITPLQVVIAKYTPMVYFMNTYIHSSD